MTPKLTIPAAAVAVAVLWPAAVSAFNAGAVAEVGCDREGQVTLTNLTTQEFIDARPDDGTWVHHYTVVGHGTGTADVGQTVQVPIVAQPGDVLTVVVKWSDSAMTEEQNVTVTGPSDEQCAPPDTTAEVLSHPVVPASSVIPPPPPDAPPTLPVTGTGTASIAAAVGSLLVGAGVWLTRLPSRG